MKSAVCVGWCPCGVSTYLLYSLKEEMDDIYETHQVKRHNREREDAVNHYLHEKEGEFHLQSNQVRI